MNTRRHHYRKGILHGIAWGALGTVLMFLAIIVMEIGI